MALAGTQTKYVQVTIKNYFGLQGLYTEFDWNLGTLISRYVFEFAGYFYIGKFFQLFCIFRM